MGDVELTLEETNKLRLSLGLKPLADPAAPLAEGEEPELDPEQVAEANYTRRREEDAKAAETKYVHSRSIWSGRRRDGPKLPAPLSIRKADLRTPASTPSCPSQAPPGADQQVRASPSSLKCHSNRASADEMSLSVRVIAGLATSGSSRPSSPARRSATSRPRTQPPGPRRLVGGQRSSPPSGLSLPSVSRSSSSSMSSAGPTSTPRVRLPPTLRTAELLLGDASSDNC
jgi:hypothetical protein